MKLAALVQGLIWHEFGSSDRRWSFQEPIPETNKVYLFMTGSNLPSWGANQLVTAVTDDLERYVYVMERE